VLSHCLIHKQRYVSSTNFIIKSQWNDRRATERGLLHTLHKKEKTCNLKTAAE